MPFRQHSEVGWLMLQLMGGLCLPFVTRDAQKRASAKERLTALFRQRTPMDLAAAQLRFYQEKESGPRAGTDRATVSDLPQTRSPGPAPRTCALCGAFPAERGHACTVDDSSAPP